MNTSYFCKVCLVYLDIRLAKVIKVNIYINWLKLKMVLPKVILEQITATYFYWRLPVFYFLTFDLTRLETKGFSFWFKSNYCKVMEIILIPKTRTKFLSHAGIIVSVFMLDSKVKIYQNYQDPWEFHGYCQIYDLYIHIYLYICCNHFVEVILFKVLRHRKFHLKQKKKSAGLLCNIGSPIE